MSLISKKKTQKKFFSTFLKILNIIHPTSQKCNITGGKPEMLYLREHLLWLEKKWNFNPFDNYVDIFYRHTTNSITLTTILSSMYKILHREISL